MRTINNANEPERLALLEKPDYETEEADEGVEVGGPFSIGSSVGPIGELFAHHYFLAAPVLLLLRIVISVLNRIIYKIMLVPMDGYAYFLSLFMSFVYLIIYSLLFAISFGAGWITDRGLFSKWALGVPKGKLLAMGACDCFGSVLGIISAGAIDGSILVILSTLTTPFTIVASLIAFKTRYCALQIIAAAVVIGGISLTIITSKGPIASGHWYFFVVNVVGLIPNVISFTLKESVFKELPGINVLVLNLFSSLFAIGFMPVAFLVANAPGLTSKPRVKCGKIDSFSKWVSCFKESVESVGSETKAGLQCFIGHTPPPVNNSHTHTHTATPATHAAPHAHIPSTHVPPVRIPSTPTPTALSLSDDVSSLSSSYYSTPSAALRFDSYAAVSQGMFGGSAVDALLLTDEPYGGGAGGGWGVEGMVNAPMTAVSNITHTHTPAHMTHDKCAPMPYPWVLYSIANVSFNILMLLVVKYGGGRPTITATGIRTTTSGSGAVVNFLVGIVASTLQFYAFSMPIFPEYAASLQKPLAWTAHVGFVVTVVGLMTYQFVSYHWRKVSREAVDKPGCMSPFPYGYYTVERVDR